MTEENQGALFKLELIISRMLRTGVLIAGTCLLVGWLWMWYHGGDIYALRFYEKHSLLESLQWALLMQNRGFFICIAGFAVLISLPLIRVFMTGVLFLKQKEFLLAALAFGVFVSLILSFTLGVEL